MTAEEFLALGETNEHYELIDGVVRMSPTPSREHQRVLSLLIFQFELFKQGHAGFDYYPDISVRFSPHHVLEPDLACFVRGRLGNDAGPIQVAPDLVIEILSPSNRAYDLTQKRALYERFDVGEYWVIDPSTGNARCFRLQEGRFEEAAVIGDVLESRVLTGFVLDLKPLRAMVRGE